MEYKYNEIIKLFKKSFQTIHKARNIIKIVEYEEKKLVVKSFKVPNLINKIVYSFFKDSKAKKSYDNSIKISSFVPKAIGFVEFKKFGLINDSYFISENFDYTFDIRKPILEKNFEARDEIFRKFARFTFELHENSIFHLDYSPGNILIKKNKDNYEFKIVDINRMLFKKLTTTDRMNNFSKLWISNHDLEIIIDEYKKYYKKDEALLFDLAKKFNDKNKNFVNFKKRLKGKKVVD